jgi:hypothetical protein
MIVTSLPNRRKGASAVPYTIVRAAALLEGIRFEEEEPAGSGVWDGVVVLIF